MAKSDRVYSTPPSAILDAPAGAAGAVELFSGDLFPARSSGVCQPGGSGGEPNDAGPTSSDQAGRHTVSRRFFMNYIATAASAAA